MSNQEMISRWMKRALLLGIGGAFVALTMEFLFFPAKAGAISTEARVEVDAACVADCTDDLRACSAEARREFLECAATNGCVELAASARVACAGDKATSACVEAKAEFSDCQKPCRVQFRQAVRACQNSALTCLRDECDLHNLPAQCKRVKVTK